MKVAINGLGRIGKQFLIAAVEGKKDWDFIINDLGDLDSLVYSLSHDSVHPSLKDVKHDYKNIIIGKKKIKVLQVTAPEDLPWAKEEIDLVVECTGMFTKRKDAEMHLNAGAKRVLISAPAEGADSTIIVGVNEDELNKESKVVSAGSCTTNAVSPLIKALHDAYKVENAYFITTHAYTATQKLIDGHASKDPTRGRAAGVNIIPTTSGAATSVVESIPDLKGKIDGYALRVPVIDGSIASVIAKVSKKTNAKEVNSLFEKLSKGKWKNMLEYQKEALVSTDIIGNDKSCIFNACFTSTQDDLVSVAAWYDNEWGYACRLVDVAEMMLKLK